MTREAETQVPRGTYVLFLEVAEAAIAVGKLGCFHFRPGVYAYVGSALGSGGLRGRLERHRRSQKRKHWHVDYLLSQACIMDLYVDCSGRRLECRWAQSLRQLPGVQSGPAGFGASDCNCPTHLFYLGNKTAIDWVSVKAVLTAAAL